MHVMKHVEIWQVCSDTNSCLRMTPNLEHSQDFSLRLRTRRLCTHPSQEITNHHHLTKILIQGLTTVSFENMKLFSLEATDLV